MDWQVSSRVFVIRRHESCDSGSAYRWWASVYRAFLIPVGGERLIALKVPGYYARIREGTGRSSRIIEFAVADEVPDIRLEVVGLRVSHSRLLSDCNWSTVSQIWRNHINPEHERWMEQLRSTEVG